MNPAPTRSANGTSWENLIRSYWPILVYLITLIWGASKISGDLDRLRSDMGRTTLAISQLEQSVQHLTRSFDKEGTSREERIRELERKVEKIEGYILRPVGQQ